MEANDRQNAQLHESFLAFLAGRGQKKELLAGIAALHNRQWSQHIHNILTATSNCANDCAYCYMKTLKHRFHGSDLEDLTMHTDPARVIKGWRRVRAGEAPKMFMFPSSHDIFPEFVDDYILAARAILAAGHELMVVTKPRRPVVDALMRALARHRGRVVFMLTITTSAPGQMAKYEARAPPLAERLACLQALHAAGFRTAVSVEPYLSDPRATLALVRPYVTEKVWIGPMSGVSGLSLDTSDIRPLYSARYMRALADDLARDPIVRFKTALMKAVVRAAP